MNRHIYVRFLALLAALLLVSTSAVAALEYPELKNGSKGPKVAALRQRLYDLGYLSSFKKDDIVFNAKTEQAVRAFERNNGLAETGVAMDTLQELMYSKDAAASPDDAARELSDLAPDESTRPEIDVPGILSDGFLPAGASPFVHQDRELGRWRYVSDCLSITIERHTKSKGGLEWYEAVIKTRDRDAGPFAVLSKRNGATFQTPKEMAEESGSVFAITDDFFGYRMRYEKRPGIIVRGGKVLSDKTRRENRMNLQPLEVLAMFEDGSLRAFSSDMFTGREYVAMGVTDTWAFGPTLVQGGIVPRYFYAKEYHSYREPRCAFGMIKPGTYAALLVTGRKESSKGAYFKWLAEKMQEMGCTEALNMDGGNTIGMLFMGELLNRSPKGQNKSIRKVSGIISFGGR